ncbi:MAG: Ppx/GppA phosphatase family protein [Alphaproteobacteria bacterium]
MEKTKAVIELGTNKWRLAMINSRGENVFYKDHPSKKSMTDRKIGEDYLFACLNDFSEELKKQGLDINDSRNVRSIATEGFRVGENSEQLIKQIKEKLGLEIEIISAKREAELSLYAIVNSSEQSNKNKLIIDMGGGSTDLALYVAEENEVVGTVSLIGSRFFLEKVNSSKGNRQNVFAKEEEKIHQKIENFKGKTNFDVYSDNLEIITNTAAIMRIASKEDQNKKFIPLDMVGQKKKALNLMLSMEKISRMSPQEVFELGYAGFNSAPQTITGAFIIKEVLAALDLDKNQKISFSLKGPKEGVAMEMFAREKSQNDLSAKILYTKKMSSR